MLKNERNEKLDSSKIDLRDYFIEDRVPSVRAYFGKVVAGNDEDYRTPFYDGKPRDEVLNAWSKILEPKLSGWDSLIEFENDLRGKVGPLSIEKPLKERLSDIEAYYDGIHLRQTPIPDDAIDIAMKKWRAKIGGLSIKSVTNTWDEMKKSTSSGNPGFMRKHDMYDLYGYGTWVDFKDKRSSMFIDGRYFEPVAILGWRGQEGGPEDSDVKQRVIWMFPMTLSIHELRYYQSLIKACQTTNLVPAWNGNDKVDEAMTHLFEEKGKNDVIICTDFTKFDQHFNISMQECALKCINMLHEAHSKELEWWTSQIWPVKFNIPLLINSKEKYSGKHGMGSGSGGTNADETLSHTVLQHEAAMRAGVDLNPYSMCLGDDGLLTFPGIDLDAVLNVYTSHGLEMNESKQYVSKDSAVYLRRWYSSEYKIDGICHGVYSTYRALGKLMGQERFYNPDDWGPEMVELRYLSIIENVKYHPLKEEFLDFCVKGDKYRLGLDIPGFFDNIEHIYEASELAQSFKSYTAGDGVGINSWWVVKALKAMR